MDIRYMFAVFGLFVTKCMTQNDPPDLGTTFSSIPPPFTVTPPAYDYEISYDDILESDRCLSRETCESNNTMYQSFPEKNCYCDPLCAIIGDCCPEFKPEEKDIPNFEKKVFECVSLRDGNIHNRHRNTVVTKCNSQWQQGDIKRNCENTTYHLDSDDSLLSVPVSEPIYNIVFKNMYCALCNYNYDYTFWGMIMTCPNSSAISKGHYQFLNVNGSSRNKCSSTFQNPFPSRENRMCPKIKPIDLCSNNNDTMNNYKEMCYTSGYSIVYFNYRMYKNKFCALCNDIPQHLLLCQPEVFVTGGFMKPGGTSFRMIVDFNTELLIDTKGNTLMDLRKCKDNEIFDPIVDKCREILCPVPSNAKQGKCIITNKSNFNHLLGGGFMSYNCTLSKLEPSEYEFINQSSILLLSSNTVYGEDMFEMSGSHVFMCLDINQTCSGDCGQAGVMFTFDDTETYLSFISIIISLVALALTFIVYIYFRDLQNTPGKILICLIVSLFLAQLMFIISSTAQNNIRVCQTVAILMHYFFLAAFCWMNIVALDLWMTFSRQFITPGSGSKSVKRFLKFSIYGWGFPMIIVSAALIVEFIDIDNELKSLKPYYGRTVCWITSKDALLLFFAGPLAIFKLFDIVAFIFTSIHIIRAKRQGAMARQKKNMCSFLINIKLSLVMGLTWVFAFVANIANVSALWYMFIVFNCLQGLFIALSFLCTRKVRRLVRGKYEGVIMSKSTSTQMTSINLSSNSP